MQAGFTGGMLLRALLAVVATSCGNGGEHAPAAARYAYSASHPAPGAGDSLRFAGVLELTHTTADSLAGQWEVPELHPELRRGGWERDAYVVYASPVHGGTLVHRIRRTGEPHELACGGYYAWIGADGDEQRVPLRCALAYAPDAPPVGIVPPMHPYTRPIDADTLPPAQPPE
ncbi:MAG TPA: hypothetical protein VGR27_09950 [Longimicrobiaceae bacterium]|nr:hypothetical protein [Longimicrobiaceae bacterium]